MSMGRKPQTKKKRTLNDLFQTSAESKRARHDDDDGDSEVEKERLAQLMRKENEAVRTFFYPVAAETASPPNPDQAREVATTTQKEKTAKPPNASGRAKVADNSNNNRWKNRDVPLTRPPLTGPCPTCGHCPRLRLCPKYDDSEMTMAAVRRSINEERKGNRDFVVEQVTRRAQPPPIIRLPEGTMMCMFTFHADGLSEWPQSSAFACWNCCHTFEGPPVMIPQKYHRPLKVYEMSGNFCSWNCAKRYQRGKTTAFYQHNPINLDLFASKYFGAQMPIYEAPPRELLDSFSNCGITIDQYRQGFQEIEYTVYAPPLIPYELVVTWQKRSSKRRNKQAAVVNKERRTLFEAQMRGQAPMPKMPDAIRTDVRPLESLSAMGKSVVVQPKKKKKRRNLLSLMSNSPPETGK